MTRSKGPWSWVLALVWTVFALLAVGILQDDRTVPGVVVGGCVLVLSAWCAGRAVRSDVRVTGEGLTYVGYARTHRLRWTQVAGVEVTDLDSLSPIESVGVVVHLRGGGELGLAALAGVAVRGRCARLERLVQECDRRRSTGS